MGPTRHVLLRAVAWAVTPVLFAAAAAVHVVRPDEAEPLLTAADVPFVVATVTCWLVGVLLTGKAYTQPAGWAFLGLGTALAWSGFTDVYTVMAHADGSDAPARDLVATLSDTSFVWWFVFLALVLWFTPPVRTMSVRRSLPRWTVLAGAVFQVAALLRSTPLDPPYSATVSPWAIRPLQLPISVVAAGAVLLVGVCLLWSAVELVRRWRAAEGPARQQLLWLVAGAVPLAPCVVASFAVSYLGHADVAGYLMAAAIVTIAVGAALSVLRYRLYDVERVVTDSAAYALASVAVLASFGVVVVVISRTTPIDPTSRPATVAATLAGAAVARAAYVWGRRAVERRLDRDRFDAVQAVRTGLAGTPDLDVLLPAALADPSVRVLYPAGDDTWVTSDGRAVSPRPDVVEVQRHGAVTAKVEFDPAQSERGVVEAAAQEASAEIDNVALRAELARQVELISESRSRLATAHLDERRRIERDLHDGAQQRLLAIALQLQSAQVNGAPAMLRAEIDRAIHDLGSTVQELRDLAGGLQPAALAGGGLIGAVADLAGRVPLRIAYDVVDQRFAPGVEGAAWFVVAEATTNAVKHADVEDLSITVAVRGDALHVTVADSGAGHADPAGHGLQGLADRVSALGGRLRVGENPPHGTVVEAELPCGS